MIGGIIRQALATKRRITIPSLGTFISRADGNIAFSAMLTDDDGELRRTVAQLKNIPESVASTRIERYVAGVKAELSATGRSVIPELGAFTKTASGAIKFSQYEPQQTAKQSINTHAAETMKQTPNRPVSSSVLRTQRKKSDWIVIVAVIVALLALIIIIFGLSQGGAQPVEPLQ